MMFRTAVLAAVALAALAGCGTTRVAEEHAPVATIPSQQCPPTPICPKPAEPKEPPPPAAPPYREAQWSDLPDWTQDDLAAAWPSLLASCKAMRAPEAKAAWSGVCAAALSQPPKPTTVQVRGFLESALAPWQIVNSDGSVEGLITGYYEPLLRGSRWKSAKFSVPILGVPDDMLVLDLGEVYPELKTMRLRGRQEGRKIVPYWSRAQIDAQVDRLPAKVLYWAADPVEFAFLQVQGSGQLELSDGSRVRLAYADQNGHPYKSVGRWLVDKGEMKADQASMQGIQAWARNNPQRLSEMLDSNPSYVFFREEPASTEGPKGSLGVPLQATRSIAVDIRTVPLGAPVFLATTRPDATPLNRLVLAQDTGGAIRGRVRADFYWGFGPEAGSQAGRMRQQGRMWVLWPRGATIPVAQ